MPVFLCCLSQLLDWRKRNSLDAAAVVPAGRPLSHFHLYPKESVFFAES